MKKNDKTTKPQTKISLYCSYCGEQHVDQGEYARNPHRWHLCLKCGKKFWIPKPTIGVKE